MVPVRSLNTPSYNLAMINMVVTGAKKMQAAVYLHQKDYEVLHSLPGRVRVRLPAIFDDQALAAGLEQVLNEQAGVCNTSANARLASVTIIFFPDLFDPITWLDQLSLDEIPRLTKKSNGHHKLPKPLAMTRRCTFAFEAFLPPKGQFVLGSASLIATLVELPAVVTGSLIAAAVLPILNRAVQTLLDERRLGADALDGATCLALIKSGNFMPAALMTALIGLGELVRDLVTLNCQRLIAHQLLLSQRSAWLIKGRGRVRVPVAELRHGDQLVVYPGELIAFEGTVLEGCGEVVPASPEMDFSPQFVRVGDRVAADMILTDGKLYIRNEQLPSLKVADPAREKQKRRWLQRTRLHRAALRAGYRRVPGLLSMAALVFALTRDPYRALTIICFDFITGIRIAIPTAVLSSMYKAGTRGIVIRNASALERLADVNAIVFVRSGTLTSLRPSVTDIFLAPGFALEEVTRLAAAVEQRYSHLAAYAIYSYANLNRVPVPERTSSSLVGGLGVTGIVEGKNVLAGSTLLMDEQAVDLSAARSFLDKCKQRGDSRVCVAVDGKLAGVIAYQDPVREESAFVIEELKRLGMEEIAMTTGGSQMAGEALAKKVGIATVHSRTSPEEQAEIVRRYKQRGLKVAVVGHDVADALALEQADLAITLSSGADIARHRADVVLTSEDLTALVEGIEIARSGMALAHQNMMVVSLPNWLGLALSLTTETEVIGATLLNNGSVIVGAMNGLRPLLAMDEAASSTVAQFG